LPSLVILVGPTAVGKTELSLKLAETFSMEIISADSMQVYRYMDIGTAKPAPAERKRVPHHLIDIVYPDETFTVADYQERYQRVYNDLHDRNVLPLLTGGTGLYIRAVTRGFIFPDPPADPRLRSELKEIVREKGKEFIHSWLNRVDPESAARIHVNDVKRTIRALEVYLTCGAPFSRLQKATVDDRLPGNIIYLGLTRDREELYRRIEERVDAMISRGLVQEVEELMGRGYGPDLQSMQGLGYKEMIPVVKGETGLDEAVNLLKRRTRRYAKRQMTWFRREPVEKWYLLMKGAEEKSFRKILDYIEGRINHVSNSKVWFAHKK